MLVKFTTKNGEGSRIGFVEGEAVSDISGRFSSLKAVYDAFPQGWSREDLVTDEAKRIALSDVHLDAPVDSDANFYAVGANYKRHAEEAGLSVPKQPVVFTKTVDALIGGSDPIILPRISNEIDYEGELAVVIGSRAYEVDAAEALKHVAGYTVVNDVTARDLQWMELGGNRIVDWLSSKGLYRSTPMGPGIMSAVAVRDASNLFIKTTLNGEVMQSGPTKDMVFDIAALIAYIAARVPLNPGDVIATGTPVGVGGFRKIFLKDGDRVVVEIEGVGRIDNIVRAHA